MMSGWMKSRGNIVRQLRNCVPNRSTSWLARKIWEDPWFTIRVPRWWRRSSLWDPCSNWKVKRTRFFDQSWTITGATLRRRMPYRCGLIWQRPDVRIWKLNFSGKNLSNGRSRTRTRCFTNRFIKSQSTTSGYHSETKSYSGSCETRTTGWAFLRISLIHGWLDPRVRNK